MKLVLFDVDGTLVNRFRVGEESFPYAIKLVFGIDTNPPGWEFSGWTDRGIIFETLKRKGVTRELTEKRLPDIFRNMRNYARMNINRDDDFRLLPNVKRLLEELDRNNVKIGLLTGNLEEVARIKLKKFGVEHHFKAGGFGSYSEKRSELAPVAISQAEERFGVKFQKKDIFIIGDTPCDIEVGKANGLKTISVCTGIFRKSELMRGNPDLILEDFTDSDKFLKAVKFST
ncbi:hypothetical protein A3K63_01085 [Candidatus Micrarchaeota archaeon RBG_16_49_10]|nr:MAG: hypothetical protein A3K63_01085 [Candidatus Micrarchaeota archaeon RBG_16_49_10]